MSNSLESRLAAAIHSPLHIMTPSRRSDLLNLLIAADIRIRNLEHLLKYAERERDEARTEAQYCRDYGAVQPFPWEIATPEEDDE